MNVLQAETLAKFLRQLADARRDEETLPWVSTSRMAYRDSITEGLVYYDYGKAIEFYLRDDGQLMGYNADFDEFHPAHLVVDEGRARLVADAVCPHGESLLHYCQECATARG